MEEAEARRKERIEWMRKEAGKDEKKEPRQPEKEDDAKKKQEKEEERRQTVNPMMLDPIRAAANFAGDVWYSEDEDYYSEHMGGRLYHTILHGTIERRTIISRKDACEGSI